LSGRGLCDELITRPGESYRLWCVVVCDLETSRMGRPWPALGRSAIEKKYIQQDTRLHSLFYLETALHVSGDTITHHQERKQLYLQHLVFVTPLLLYAAIVEELELVWVCCGWRTPKLKLRHPQHTQTSSNSSTIAADSNNGVTNTRCCRYSCLRFWWWVMVPPETSRAVSR